MFRPQLLLLLSRSSSLPKMGSSSLTTRATRLLFSTTAPRHLDQQQQFKPIPIQITGTGTGTQQQISIPGKEYTIQTDTYSALGGQDSHPSPVSYSLASLSSCTQVTGSLVARDHGIRLGRWSVTVDAVLPTAVLVGGAQQGNPNWESVKLSARVQTDVSVTDPEGKAKFKFFVDEVERRCPITALFKLSGVKYESEWVNEEI